MKPMPIPRMSWAEYLEFEQTADVKHEFHDGELFPMVGVTRTHATLASNLHGALFAHLRDDRCRPYFSDFKVYIEAVNRALYPDVFVDCNQVSPPTDLYTTDVPLIIEVLSKSTEAYDRGDKFTLYK